MSEVGDPLWHYSDQKSIAPAWIGSLFYGLAYLTVTVSIITSIIISSAAAAISHSDSQKIMSLPFSHYKAQIMPKH
jgi:hypothetical protein